MIQTFTTSQGLRIVTETMTSIQTAGLSLFVNTGSKDEEKEHQGISHFLEHMLFKGSHEKNALELAREMDQIGSSFNAATGREYTVYHAHVPSPELKKALRLLFDIVFVPAFTKKDIEREKKIITEELKENEDDPEQLAYDLLLEQAWHRSPYSHPILGTEKTINALTLTHLLKYYRKHYHPQNMILGLAGNFCPEKIFSYIENLLKRKKFPAPQRPPSSPKLSFSPAWQFKKKQIEQVHFWLAFPGESFLSHKIYPFIALDAILGNGVSSRLFHRIREKKGLAYSIFSSLHSVKTGGLLTIYTSTTKGKWLEALKSVFTELKRLREQGIHAQELTLVKKSLQASWLLSMESSLNRAFKIAKDYLFHKRVVPVEESLQHLMNLTPEAVAKITTRFHKKNLAFAAVGDFERKEAENEVQKLARLWL